ncbi:MAG: hypothetical protein QM775_09855 [Pirellulales bacterium]
MLRNTFVYLFVAGIFTADAAFAQPPMFDPGEMVKRLDENNNGQVDPDEMNGRRAGLFGEHRPRQQSRPVEADRQRQAARHHEGPLSKRRFVARPRRLVVGRLIIVAECDAGPGRESVRRLDERTDSDGARLRRFGGRRELGLR